MIKFMLDSFLWKTLLYHNGLIPLNIQIFLLSGCSAAGVKPASCLIEQNNHSVTAA